MIVASTRYGTRRRVTAPTTERLDGRNLHPNAVAATAGDSS